MAEPRVSPPPTPGAAVALPLRARVHEGDDVDDAVLRELWRLRLEMLTLTRPEEQDWAEFRANTVGAGRFVFAFRDPDGVAQGFFTIATLPVDLPRRRLLLMYSKYFYFRPAYRGHPKTILVPWVLAPIQLRRHGLRSLHFVTTAFPQSYVSLTRTAGRTWSLRQDDTPAWAREALHAFGQHFCPDTFDPETGLVRGSNVADADSLPRSAEARRLAERYEELNPYWRDGVSMPILFSVDPRLVRHNAVRVARRFLRR